MRRPVSIDARRSGVRVASALAVLVALCGCTSAPQRVPVAPAGRVATVPAAAAVPADAPRQDASRARGLDAAARARLVGEHMLTLQWLGFGDLSRAGTFTVVDDGGAGWRARGEQRVAGPKGDDYVQLDGRIVAATADGFVFEGDIVTRVDHINAGEPCARSGRFTFRTRDGRKYWRLQEMQGCDGTTDYVDVYFKGI